MLGYCAFGRGQPKRAERSFCAPWAGGAADSPAGFLAVLRLVAGGRGRMPRLRPRYRTCRWARVGASAKRCTRRSV